MIAGRAFAEPTGYAVKAGTLLTEDDQVIEVDSGLFLNKEGADVVRSTMTGLIDQNAQLIASLERANAKLDECSTFIPGLPTWAYVAISVALTALTAVAGVMVGVAGGS